LCVIIINSHYFKSVNTYHLRRVYLNVKGYREVIITEGQILVNM